MDEGKHIPEFASYEEMAAFGIPIAWRIIGNKRSLRNLKSWSRPVIAMWCTSTVISSAGCNGWPRSVV